MSVKTNFIGPLKPFHHGIPKIEETVRKVKPMSENAATQTDPPSDRRSIDYDPNWFNLKKLWDIPIVQDTMLWRNRRFTALVFGIPFVMLLAIVNYSAISVVAVTGSAILTLCMIYRSYQAVLQSMHRTSTGDNSNCMYRKFDVGLDSNASILGLGLIYYANRLIMEVCSIFLVERFSKSLKFYGILCCLCLIGDLFNAITLIILAFLALFTLPKFYETYKIAIHRQIQNIVRHVNFIYNFKKQKKQKKPANNRDDFNTNEFYDNEQSRIDEFNTFAYNERYGPGTQINARYMPNRLASAAVATGTRSAPNICGNWGGKFRNENATTSANTAAGTELNRGRLAGQVAINQFGACGNNIAISGSNTANQNPREAAAGMIIEQQFNNIDMPKEGASD